MKIPMVSHDRWRALFNAADKFRALAPWKYMEDDILFGVKDPHSGDTFYCCVIGALGQVFGLMAFRGAEGYDVWRKSHEGEAGEDDNGIFGLQIGLKVEFLNKSELNDEDKSVMAGLGVSYKGRKACPEFRSLLPGYVPWHISEKEACSLISILQTASRFIEDKRDDFAEHQGPKPKVYVYHPTLTAEKGGEIAADWEFPLSLAEEPVPVIPLDVFRLRKLRKAKPTEERVWEGDFFHHPGGTVSDADRPYWMRLVVVAAHRSGLMLNMSALAPDQEPNAALADLLMAAIERHGQKPTELYVRNRFIAQALKPVAAAMNIAVSSQPSNLDGILEMKRALDSMPSDGELGNGAGFDSSEPVLARGTMEETLSGFERPAKKTALARAQEVAWEAMDEPDGKRRIALAQSALTISSDCADAYVLLAEEATRLGDALNLYRAGVEAGERAIGKKGFKDFEGHFWGHLETRPYMRARAGLADCLWEEGKREESVEQYKEMLRLNPNDNQGIRYLLAPKLLLVGRYGEVEALLKEYKDDRSAEWMYGRVLLVFQKNGGGAAARDALGAAVQYNKYVPKYLLGEKKLPRNLPDYVGFGDEDEAVSYVYDNLEVWEEIRGALLWLSSAIRGIKGNR